MDSDIEKEKKKTNQLLFNTGKEIRDWYVQYFGNLLTTNEEDQSNVQLRESLITKFAVQCNELIYTDIFQKVNQKFHGFYSENSRETELNAIIRIEFHNAIFVVLNRWYFDALSLLYKNNLKDVKEDLGKEEGLDKEEIELVFLNTVSYFTYNYNEKEQAVFLEKCEENLEKYVYERSKEKTLELKNIKGFIYTIVKRRVIDHQRKLLIELKQVDFDADLTNLSGGDIVFYDEESIGAKWNVFSQLKRENQIFMLLRYRYQTPKGKNGMSFSDIAKIYDSTEGTMKSKRHRILEQLAQFSPKENVVEPLEPDYNKLQEVVGEREDSILKKVIIVEEQKKAKTLFIDFFKRKKEYWIMLRWQWIFEPSNFTVADIYDIIDEKKIDRISSYHKTVLWEYFKQEKIIH